MSEHDEWAERPDELSEPEETAEEAKIDLNTATEEDLLQLPGIGPALAARIVEYRAEIGGFREVADVKGVPGIAEATYATIADRLAAHPVERETAELEMEADEEPAAQPELEPPDEGEEWVLTEEEAVPTPEAEPFEEDEEWAAEMEPLAEPEPEWVAAAEEAFVEEEEAELPEPEPEPIIAAEAPPRAPAPPPLRAAPREEGHWGRLLGFGLASALLGALLSLLVLYAVNGTLDFRAASSRDLQRESYRLEGEIGALGAEVQDVQDRLNAVQDLAGRVDTLQTDLQWLQEDMASAQTGMASLAEELAGVQEAVAGLSEGMAGLQERAGAIEEQIAGMQEQVNAVAEQIGALSERVETLRETAERFDGFLGGLRQLLNESLGPVTPTPPATPAPRVTATAQPMVTVIPLATPTPTPTSTP